MESTGGSKGSSSVEQIKVEPDFYFPAADVVLDDDEDDLDGEEQLEMYQIDLDSPVKQMLVGDEEKFDVTSDFDEDDENEDDDECEDNGGSISGQGRTYECEVCRKQFYSPGHLSRHERIHTGVKPYQCTHCDKAFIEASSLKVHLRTHTGEKPYRCEICDRHFTQSCNLQSHYRRNHGVDPKAGSQLFNQMRQQQQLSFRSSPWPLPQQSVRAMPKLIPKPAEQPFQCCVCDEPFFDRDLLLIHEETHVPEAPFECRFCSTMFSDLPDLRSHVNVHKASLRGQPQALHPIRQSTAGIRVFANGPVAKRRLETQSEAANASAVLNSNQPFESSGDDQYPYKCVECKGTFQKQELYFHMRAHLKQKNIFSKKSHKCDQCDKVFEKDLTLKKHMDMAHPTVSSVSSGDGSFLLEALKTDARSLSPEATKSGKVSVSSEVELKAPVEVKQEPESALGDDEVNSTVSDNPILTQLLNTNSSEQQQQQQQSKQNSRNGTPVNAVDSELSNEGGFVISAVATVDHSFLERLERMERQQKKQQQHQQQQPELVDVQPAAVSMRRMPVLEESLRRPPVTSANKPAAMPQIPIITGPFRCSFCLKMFNEHFGLRQHMRAMHYSEKRHKCKECGKKFSLGISLAIHLRVHTSVRPFTCIVCYKTFTRSTALNGHLSSHSYGRVKCAECGETQLSVFNYMEHIKKFHPDFLQNVATYRTKAETLMQRRRQLILEITQGLAEHRSEIPNVLARLRGEAISDHTRSEERNKDDDEDEVSSSEQVELIKRERPDSSQSEEVSSASEEHEVRRSLKRESLPALRAELRKRPLRSNTTTNELDESVLPPFRKSARTAGNSSPNLKRLLEQNSATLSGGHSEATEQEIPPAVTVKNEPSE